MAIEETLDVGLDLLDQVHTANQCSLYSHGAPLFLVRHRNVPSVVARRHYH